MAAAGALLSDVEALALPAACLACGAYLAPGRDRDACCPVCRSRMRRLAPPACARCGQPLDPWDGRASAPRPAAERGSASCGFCRSWPPAFAWAASAVWMEEGPARELVHALKYGGWRVAAGPMADALARGCDARLAGAELLVPVPLGRRRLRSRGYNQAGVLARALAERLAARVDEGALARTRETRSQTALSPAGRWANVAGAFVAHGAVAGRRVAVVDDVLTTGATLAACAVALAAQGAVDVGAVTFARAVVPD